MNAETSKTEQTESKEEAVTLRSAEPIPLEKTADSVALAAAPKDAASNAIGKGNPLTGDEPAPEEEIGKSEKADATDADTDEEEEIPVDPLDERVFGMPRMCFHGAAFGVAGGYIVSGLIGLVSGKTPSATTCAIACAALGYLLTKQQHKKLLAKRDGDKQE